MNERIDTLVDELIDELADEFSENGLDDVAEILRRDGFAPARAYVAQEIADNEDDHEGWRLHNLEVARDHLEAL